jgi:hypothetical protein
MQGGRSGYDGSMARFVPYPRLSDRLCTPHPTLGTGITRPECEADQHLTCFHGWSYLKLVVKGKAVPLQARTGPKGSRRLRLPDFKAVGT